MRLSIVTTLYGSASFIEEFYRRIVAAAEQVMRDVEIIMVNDGSPDDSLAVAVGLHRRDPRVVVVDLSRNFGHHRAMMAGLAYARGELVFLIDSDLEEQPEELVPFHERMRQGDCDVVYGVQAKRRGSRIEVMTGTLFYWIIRGLGGIDLPKNLTTTRLMTQRYVRALLRHTEREVMIGGLWVLTGFTQVALPIVKLERGKPSHYRSLAKIRLAVDYVTAFSGNLLYHVFYAGLGLSALAFLAMAYFVSRFLITGDVLAGWTSLMASIWMFGGLSIVLIGLLGIYVARIFEETKRRPYVIVRRLYGGEAPSGDDDLMLRDQDERTLTIPHP
jgi:putative glycosyltransferase